MVEYSANRDSGPFSSGEHISAMARSIRQMRLEDIPQVAEIEREAFPIPWPATNFRRELTSNSLTYYVVACEEMASYEQLPPEVGACAPGQTRSPSQFGRLRSGLSRLLRGQVVSAPATELVLGFAGVWFIADEAHLANIAVREAYQRRGIGENLLICVMRVAVERNARFITLEVRMSNEAARALYGKYGFAEVGTRPGYYTDNKEDAVLMTADTIDSAAFRAGFDRLVKDYALRWRTPAAEVSGAP